MKKTFYSIPMLLAQILKFEFGVTTKGERFLLIGEKGSSFDFATMFRNPVRGKDHHTWIATGPEVLPTFLEGRLTREGEFEPPAESDVMEKPKPELIL